MDIPTQYCERLVDGGFEPVNTISNLAFFVAALLAFWMIRNYKGILKFILPLLLASIGVGSGVWHAQHSHLGDVADTGTIVIFASVVAILLLRKLLKSATHVTLAFVLLLGLALQTERLSYLNGSVPYLVLLVGFATVSIFLYRKLPGLRGLLLAALCTFALAILFRVTDLSMCSTFPVGTHFLWHVLIAVLGYQLILLVLKES